MSRLGSHASLHLGEQRVVDTSFLRYITQPWDDSLAFIFDGGTLTSEQVAQLQLAGTELERFEFVDAEEAAKRLRDYVWRRVERAWRAVGQAQPVYLMDGRDTPGSHPPPLSAT